MHSFSPDMGWATLWPNFLPNSSGHPVPCFHAPKTKVVVIGIGALLEAAIKRLLIAFQCYLYFTEICIYYIQNWKPGEPLWSAAM
jgi:hypothetical protein